MDVEFDKIKTNFILKTLLDSVILIAGEYLLILTFQHSLYAEINQGVISSLFILSAINTAIFTWFIIGVRSRLLPGQDDAFHFFMYREQCNRYHFISLAILVLCIGLLIFNPYSEKPIVSVFGKKVKIQPPMTAIVLAIITTIYFSVKDMVFKSHIIRYMVSPYKLYSMVTFFGGLIMMVV